MLKRVKGSVNVSQVNGVEDFYDEEGQPAVKDIGGIGQRSDVVGIISALFSRNMWLEWTLVFETAKEYFLYLLQL